MITIPIAGLFGDCAVDPEAARKTSSVIIAPIFYLLEVSAKADINDYIDEVELDFTGVNYATQIFFLIIRKDFFA